MYKWILFTSILAHCQLNFRVNWIQKSSTEQTHKLTNNFWSATFESKSLRNVYLQGVSQICNIFGNVHVKRTLCSNLLPLPYQRTNIVDIHVSLALGSQSCGATTAPDATGMEGQPMLQVIPCWGSCLPPNLDDAAAAICNISSALHCTHCVYSTIMFISVSENFYRAPHAPNRTGQSL